MKKLGTGIMTMWAQRSRETGGIMISPIPFVTKPTYVTFTIQPVLMDENEMKLLIEWLGLALNFLARNC
jgi:hypothetical protein